MEGTRLKVSVKKDGQVRFHGYQLIQSEVDLNERAGIEREWREGNPFADMIFQWEKLGFRDWIDTLALRDNYPSHFHESRRGRRPGADCHLYSPR